MYNCNNKSNEKQVKERASNMESELASPCNNFPLSKSIPQTCGKRGRQPFCFNRWIFLGQLPLVPVFQILGCILRNTELQTQEAAFQAKEFSSFLCMGRCKSQSSLELFSWHIPQLSEGLCPILSEFSQGSPQRVAACQLVVLPQGLPAHTGELPLLIPFFSSSHCDQEFDHYLGDIS